MEPKKLSVYQAFKESAQNVLDNFAPFVIAFAKTILFTIASFMVVGGIAFLIGGAPMVAELKQMADKAKSLADSKITLTAQHYQAIALAGINFFLRNIIPFALASIAGVILSALLSLAFTRFSLNITDKKHLPFEIFSSENFKLIPIYLAASALFWLIVGAGFMCFIIPGLYLYIRLAFFSYFIVDQKAGVIDSLKKSWNLTTGYGWDLFVLYLIYWLMQSLGPVGMIITASIGILMIANAYRQLTGKLPDKKEQAYA